MEELKEVSHAMHIVFLLVVAILFERVWTEVTRLSASYAFWKIITKTLEKQGILTKIRVSLFE